MLMVVTQIIGALLAGGLVGFLLGRFTPGYWLLLFCLAWIGVVSVMLNPDLSGIFGLAQRGEAAFRQGLMVVLLHVPGLIGAIVGGKVGRYRRHGLRQQIS